MIAQNARELLMKQQLLAHMEGATGKVLLRSDATICIAATMHAASRPWATSLRSSRRRTGKRSSTSELSRLAAKKRCWKYIRRRRAY